MKNVVSVPTTPLIAARDTIAPVLSSAVDRTAPVLEAAKDKAWDAGVDLLTSDVALEARRRGSDVIRAVKGEVGPSPARWPLALGCLAVGVGLGVGLGVLAQRLRTPVPQLDPYPAGDTTLGGVSEEVGTPLGTVSDVSSNGSEASVAGAAPSV